MGFNFRHDILDMGSKGEMCMKGDAKCVMEEKRVIFFNLVLDWWYSGVKRVKKEFWWVMERQNRRQDGS